MELGGNTVLVTGGASGIGLGLAERLLAAGSEVILCGRREEKLREAKAKHPRFHVRACDLTREEDRAALAAWATKEFPGLNVLVNNAGIQVRARLDEPGSWPRFREELAANLAAPLHLSMRLLPHLVRQPRAAIWNVSSGLAFVPLTRAPVYSATKAAIHSFTLSLRHQLAGTPVRVVEIVPPATDTDLGGAGLHKFGVIVDALLDDVLARIADGELEVAHGAARRSSRATRDELDEIFRQMNEPPA
jgi:uncharacterized oxidoreductase